MFDPIFTGVGTALVTPFLKNGDVDYQGIRNLVELQIAGGTNAIVACGTTGEKSTLRHEEHLKVIETIIDAVNHRVPVIAGTGSNDTRYTVELSNEAESLGVDALLLVTPYYNKTSQEGLITHYYHVADRVQSPIILYNVPSRTGLNILPETYEVLSKHPNILATKEANRDISTLAKTVALCGDALHIYSGNDDQTIPMISMGAKGVISVFSNLCPNIMSSICQLALAGRFNDAVLLQNRFLPLINDMFCDVNPTPIKEAMNLMGIPVGCCRMPLGKLSPKNKEKIHSRLVKLGMI